MAIRTPPQRLLKFEQFSSVDYPGLNGAKTLTATKLQVERSLLMVGYPSARAAIAMVGPWRATLLSALVEGYLTSQLRPSPYFLALEPSERISTTFLLAQAFTHWMADAHMSVPILLHVTGTTPSWSLSSLPLTGKPGAGTIKNKSRPDFIGIAPSGYHVFESKGRSLPTASTSLSSTLASGCMAVALAQVSRIATISGMPPKTRTAAVWVLRSSGLRGYITDPPAARSSYDLKFDLSLALVKYYRIVLDAAASFVGREGAQFVRFALSERRELVVDKKLLSLLQGLQSNGVDGRKVLSLLERRAPFYHRARRLAARMPELAFGLDGVGLVGATKDFEEMLEPPPVVALD